MKRDIMVAYNNFAANAIPAPLVGVGNAPLDKIKVHLTRLCHHLYLDNYSVAVPKPNPFSSLYSKFITALPSLEFISGSLGSHKEARIAESMKLGKAFCRWFLGEFFHFSLFGHMDDLLNKPASAQYNNMRVTRAQAGDTPDYLCVGPNNRLFLAEAKGRQHEAVSFQNANFIKWRQQFSRVNVLNPQNLLRRVKGYIVATRLKLDSQPKVVSRIYAEDPMSPGEVDLGADEGGGGMQRLVMHNHYAYVLNKLALPLHSAALLGGVQLEEAPVEVGIWQCRLPPLSKVEFVGGLIPPEDWQASISDIGWYLSGLPNGWHPNLVASRATFFGLDRQLFGQVLAETRPTTTALAPIGPFELADVPLPDQISLLRDGTLLIPASFMRFLRLEEL